MNKLIIILLVVCLVSVHAFVKRDAPEAPKNEHVLEDLSKNIQDGLKQFGEKVGETFSADNVQKALDQAKQFIEDLKPKDTPKA